MSGLPRDNLLHEAGRAQGADGPDRGSIRHAQGVVERRHLKKKEEVIWSHHRQQMNRSVL
jgi:hypothetical protein